MIDYNYSGLTGEVVTRGDFSYEEDRKAWNRAIEKYPLVIVFCYNNKDVTNAIVWAREKGLPIRIRSGAHNYEGFSTGNDVVVIDVSRMDNIGIDEEKSIVKIDAGVRNRELYEVTGALGYPFPGGGCPTVGVVGLTLGGGWGYSGRYLGLACDSLIELELIDYRGETIVANKEKNKDLFWACRGAGGGNFGVITSMTFNIPKKVSNVTLIRIDSPKMTLMDRLDFMEAYQEEFEKLDNRINFKMSVYNSSEKGKGVKIIGIFYGQKDEAKEIIAPFEKYIDMKNISLEELSILEANRIIQDSHPVYEKYKSTGRFIVKRYSRRELEDIIEIIDEMADGADYTAITFYGMGGAISEMDNDETSFNHRGAKYIMGFQSVWEEAKYAQNNRKWLVEKFKYIKNITEGSFINFPIAELDDYESEYFGENKELLRKIKGKYDPENIFDFPQGIKPYLRRDDILNNMD